MSFETLIGTICIMSVISFCILVFRVIHETKTDQEYEMTTIGYIIAVTGFPGTIAFGVSLVIVSVFAIVCESMWKTRFSFRKKV